MLLYHFIHWSLAMGTTKVADDLPLAIDCLRPSQWAAPAIDDCCVWLTTNPDPEPVVQPVTKCPYLRIEVRLPRTYRLKRFRPQWDLSDMLGGTKNARLILRAMKREWWRCYEPIPRDCFTAVAITGEPFWCDGPDQLTRDQ
jgi:hypothetical protein